MTTHSVSYAILPISVTLDLMAKTGELFERAVEIMARLRAPGGCPWDREQTFDTIKRYTVEETYEVLESIDNRDWEELPGELGDLLLQILFYAEMAQEAGHFTLDEVLTRLSDKLVNRHPHVFGDVTADNSNEVLRNWEAIKAEEKKLKSAGAEKSILAGVPSGFPGLLEASKLSSKAAHVGFEWTRIEDLFAKLDEEVRELKDELMQVPSSSLPPSQNREPVSDELRAKIEEEVGDLFFVMVNVARYLKIDPESALKRTNRKFRRRFQYMEEKLKERGHEPASSSLDEMESLWQEAKRHN